MSQIAGNQNKARLLAGVAVLALCTYGTSPAISATKVGVAAAVNLDAKSTRSGATKIISLGQNVIHNEKISTDAEGLVQILLVDGTTFTVGPNSQLTIDEFVYDPNTGNATVVASVAKGAFRFIGGQTSRKKGGATINTPAGSIGIRGAMVEGDVQGNSASFSMIFGDEMSFLGRDGGSQRLFQPGFTLRVSPNGRTTITPRTSGDASALQTSLAGRRGKTGGAKKPPTDGAVADSGVGTANSTSLSGGIPVPTDRPVQSSDLDEVDDSITDVDEVADVDVEEEITGNARIVSAPTNKDGGYQAIFLQEGDDPILDAGSRGLVGSTEATDYTVTLTKSGGNLIASGPSGGSFVLPDFTGAQGDEGLEEITDVTGTSPSGTVGGTVYAGQSDFAAYLLGVDDDPTNPFYIITGTETDVELLLAEDTETSIRTYSLTRDPIQNFIASPGTGSTTSGSSCTSSCSSTPEIAIVTGTGTEAITSVPFFNPQLYGSLDNTAQMDLRVVERDEGFFKTFLTWIDISDTEDGQKSAIFVTAGGGVELENGNIGITGNRTGSFRANSYGPIYNMTGGSVQSLAGANGGYAYGPNAENFVLGNMLDPSETFNDFSSGFCMDECEEEVGSGYLTDHHFGTIHVADLESEDPIDDFYRTSRTRTGFMVGLAESSPDETGVPYTVAAPVGEGFSPNFSVTIDAESSEVSALGIVYNVFGVGPEGEGLLTEGFALPFGSVERDVGEGEFETDFGENAFVDDDTFGATHNSNPENTQISLLERIFGGEGYETVAVDSESVAVTSTSSYMVSGRATPLESEVGTSYTHCTECSFADWGWWGTRITTLVEDGESVNERSEFVHMGTWVAGDITNPDDLTGGPTDASYDGSVLANVASDEYGQYIAKGEFSLNIDLADRSGEFEMAIGLIDQSGNFTDNIRTGFYESTVSDASSATQALYIGDLYGDGFSEGIVSGALVNDGEFVAAGTIGQFYANGDDGQITGTFMGGRDPGAAIIPE
tara:strand:+ start:34829 stop:37834 length:3006 start_codon:yes stop_codon:yes gene_type:complete